MTLQEVCQKYHISESSMTKNFLRSQAAIEKKYKVRIVKEGRGKNVKYHEQVLKDCDNRALTIYKEGKMEIPFNKQNISLVNWDFLVFLTIAITPMGVFRGSFNDFLKYIEVPITESNIKTLKNSLENLQDKGLIQYVVDKTDDTYFAAFILRKVEKDMKIGLDMVKDCQSIQKSHHKRSWVPILKVWLSIELFVQEGHQPYTVKDIKNMTGLSDYQVRENVKLLKESQIFRSSKVYASYTRCLGTVVDLNNPAFYDVERNKQ